MTDEGYLIYHLRIKERTSSDTVVYKSPFYHPGFLIRTKMRDWVRPK